MEMFADVSDEEDGKSSPKREPVHLIVLAHFVVTGLPHHFGSQFPLNFLKPPKSNLLLLVEPIYCVGSLIPSLIPFLSSLPLLPLPP